MRMVEVLKLLIATDDEPHFGIVGKLRETSGGCGGHLAEDASPTTGCVHGAERRVDLSGSRRGSREHGLVAHHLLNRRVVIVNELFTKPVIRVSPY